VKALATAFVLLCLAAGCQGPPHGGAGDASALDPDDYPLSYSLGTFDGRFGITEKEFLDAVKEAAAVWEKPAGRPLFRHEDGAPFRVNLVFDERQAKTLEAGKIRARIDSKGRSYDALVWQHDRRSERLRESERRYAEAAEGLRERLEEHNARVAYWNERGGAPAEEYAGLNERREALGRERKDVERLESDMNEDLRAVNELAAEINELAAANNIDVTYYNGKFVESREFEQGVYSGRDITIYQFSGPPELKIALVHELGHALGFRHVDDPTAIMHYKMGKQNLDPPALGDADLAMLKRKFGGD
jgi:hypothetical protein